MPEEEKTQPKPLEFPMSFSKCPACGCPDTIGGQATQEEHAKGTLPKDIRLMVVTASMPLRDMRRQLPGLPVPVVFVHFDVCLQCGCLYCIGAEKKSVSMQAPMGRAPM